MNTERLMLIAADELRAHGHPDLALYARAVRWFQTQSSDKSGLAEAYDASGQPAAAESIWVSIGDIECAWRAGCGRGTKG